MVPPLSPAWLTFINQACEDGTGFTGIELVLVLLLGMLPARATHKPAKVPAVKFPGWAILLFQATLSLPARDQRFVLMALTDNQEIEIPGNVRRNGAPALFIAVDGFQAHAQDVRQLLLSLA